MRPVPSATEYAKAFSATMGTTTDFQRSFVVNHYKAADKTATATELAHSVGRSSYRVTNRWYGQLARKVSEELGLRPDSLEESGDCWLCNLVTFEKRQHQDYLLHLRPEVAEALEQLGWV